MNLDLNPTHIIIHLRGQRVSLEQDVTLLNSFLRVSAWSDVRSLQVQFFLSQAALHRVHVLMLNLQSLGFSRGDYRGNSSSQRTVLLNTDRLSKVDLLRQLD